MGADAIIGFHSSIFDGKQHNSIKRWGSGLAVKFLVDSDTVVTDRPDIVVGILPVVNLDSTDFDNMLEDNQSVLEAAQYRLEKSGYFALLPQDTTIVLFGDLQNFDDERLDLLGGKRAGLLLLISMENAGSGGIGIIGSGNATISAKLISKDSRNVVWENIDSGSTVTFGLLNTMVAKHRRQAIYKAVKNVFDTLNPRYAEMSGRRRSRR